MNTATAEKQNKIMYISQAENFSKIPGSPVAYWISKQFLNIFDSPSFYDMSISDGKNVTGDNDRFLRLLWEVDASKVGVGEKYLKYLKGGPYRKWYGNVEYLIDWSATARDFYHKDKVSRIIPEYLWYREGISWTLIASTAPSFRYKMKDSTFDGGGLTIFLKDDTYLKYYMAMFNSSVFPELEKILNPTLNLLVKDIRSIPMIIKKDRKEKIDCLVERNIKAAQDDWNSFETSWDFKKHPLI